MIITGGKYKGRQVIAPDEHITRPPLSKDRMGVFNTLFSMIGEADGKSFLDLFGGSGIMGLEALSRGFNEVVVFEKNPKAAQIIKKNYSELGLTPNLRIGDSLKFLQTTDKIFDVVYVDPPYMSGIYETVFVNLSGKANLVIAEHSEDIPTPANFNMIKTKNYGGKKVSFFECL